MDKEILEKHLNKIKDLKIKLEAQNSTPLLSTNQNYIESQNLIPSNLFNIKEGAILSMIGSDWNIVQREHLIKLNMQIKAILALDDEAVIYAHRHGYPVYVAEDFVDYDTLCKVADDALKFSETWYENIKDLYTADNIVWPDIDHECLLYFFLEVFTSKAICDAALKKGEKLIGVVRTPYEPREYYYAKDTFGQVCKNLKYDNTSIIECSIDTKCLGYNNLVVWNTEFFKIIQDKYICVLNPLEVFRSKEILIDIYNQVNGNLIVFTHGFKVDDDMPMPVIPIDISLSKYDKKMFIDAWHALDKNIQFASEGFNKTIIQALFGYHMRRWPSLHHIFKNFLNVFLKYRPKCILGTSLPDAESQLAFAASNQLGIPSYAWGHALNPTFLHWHPYTAKKTLIPTNQGVLAAKDKMVPDCRYIAVKKVDRTNLYKSKKAFWPDRIDLNEKRVLVLPRNPRMNGTSILLSDFRKMQSIIRHLCDIPKNDFPPICLRFKMHPMDTFMGPFLESNIMADEWCFPKDSELLPLIKESDICISLDDCLCSLNYACLLVPTILVCNQNYFKNFSGIFKSTYKNYPFICNDYTKIWFYIKQIIEDDNFRKDLLIKQQSFAMLPQNSLTWSDFIEKLV